MIGRVLLGLVLLYPLVSHTAAIADTAEIGSVYLLFLIFLVSLQCLMLKQMTLALLWGSISFAGIGVMIQGNNPMYLGFFPPVLINLYLLIIFALSLREGKIPFVTRYAILIDGELNERQEQYTRRVTWLWVFVFAALCFESGYLALYSSISTWSLFANGINYMVIISVFVVEYMVRIKLFPETTQSFLSFIKQIITIKPSKLLQWG